MNQYQEEPVTGYIRISFDNYANWEGDIVSDDVLINSKITYCQYRMSVDTRYMKLGWSKLLSLEKAEEMLEKAIILHWWIVGHVRPCSRKWM